jgi:hypothetical protein
MRLAEFHCTFLSGMEAGGTFSQLIHPCRVELIAVQASVKQTGLIKLTHFQAVIDNISRATQFVMVALPTERQDIKVNIR